ncbi:hypothetical protein A2U01_0113808, partial [Trifolium medium]|nr:hypothetical protein [Trifolium medium]
GAAAGRSGRGRVLRGSIVTRRSEFRDSDGSGGFDLGSALAGDLNGGESDDDSISTTTL